MSLIQELRATGFAFKKSLGQNFIADENFLQSIVADLHLSETDTVVEVGTGAGTLTRVLAGAAKQVITYEVDKRLAPILEKQFAAFQNIELIFEDALKVSSFPTSFKLIANIPYYITTPLLMKFINEPACTQICVLVQSDVAKRIVAASACRDYGALSVTMQAAADCKILRKVPRGMFVPSPDVDSAFVVCTKRDAAVAYPDVMERMLKGLFAARRKTIINGLQGAFSLAKQDALELLNRAGINEGIRPEEVSVEAFINLSTIIAENRADKPRVTGK